MPSLSVIFGNFAKRGTHVRVLN